jgi:hypothetical protein
MCDKQASLQQTSSHPHHPCFLYTSNMDAAEQELYEETEAYAEAILFPNFAEKYDPYCRPPVWAEVRSPPINLFPTNTTSTAMILWKV